MKKVFENIALSFSGGGFRAASYSLGTLSLLERVGLLEDVKAISSVSGGSITAVKYAQSQIDLVGFNTFFSEYHGFLINDELADDALKNLGSFGGWRDGSNLHKRPNPINAFSIAYNKFTKNRTFKDLDNAIEQNHTHLERVIINATDFDNGLSFRFQNTGSNRYRFGNGELDKSYMAYYDHIKLGDALAASSAFPGGFEPIYFPHDFTLVTDENLDPISLMDGGIVDNQGTSSLLTGKAFADGVDLFLISDVSSPYMEKLKPTKRGWISGLISFVFSLPMLLLSIIGVIWSYQLESRLVYSLFFVVFAILLTIQVIMFFISRKVKSMVGSRFRLTLSKMSLGIFLLDRINSLIHMTTEVSLKGFRRANASSIYSDHHAKTISSMIYELRCDNDEGRPEGENYWKRIANKIGAIPDTIKKLSREATAFGTTLWFNDASDIKIPTATTLIACGEVTACYNLLSFLLVQKADELQNSTSPESILYVDLIVLWRAFGKDPYLLVNSRIKKRQ